MEDLSSRLDAEYRCSHGIVWSTGALPVAHGAILHHHRFLKLVPSSHQSVSILATDNGHHSTLYQHVRIAAIMHYHDFLDSRNFAGWSKLAKAFRIRAEPIDWLRGVRIMLRPATPLSSLSNRGVLDSRTCYS